MRLEYLALGCGNVQVCTAAMVYGFKIVQEMIDGLSNYMDDKGYATIGAFRGMALPTVTDWQHLNLAYTEKAVIDQSLCIQCGRCHIACEDTSHQAITATKDGSAPLRGHRQTSVWAATCASTCARCRSASRCSRWPAGTRWTAAPASPCRPARCRLDAAPQQPDAPVPEWPAHHFTFGAKTQGGPEHDQPRHPHPRRHGGEHRPRVQGRENTMSTLLSAASRQRRHSGAACIATQAPHAAPARRRWMRRAST